MSEIGPWEVLDSQVLVERRWLRLKQERVRTSSGVVIDEFHVIESPPWVGVVCVTERRELVLVEQYRHGYGGISLELPAGVIDEAEPVERAAARELLEETGYVSDDWAPLWSLCPEPARHAQRAHFLVARGARRASEQRLDETENVRVVTRSLDSIDEIALRMVHGVHVGALLWAERRGLLG